MRSAKGCGHSVLVSWEGEKGLGGEPRREEEQGEEQERREEKKDVLVTEKVRASAMMGRKLSDSLSRETMSSRPQITGVTVRGREADADADAGTRCQFR